MRAANRKDLSHHTRAEHRKNGYACEHCPSVFADRKHWHAHLATHDPARERFPCPHDGCGKAFTTVRAAHGLHGRARSCEV